MIWLVYIICGIIVLLAIFILVKEIRKMLKGKFCENCKSCAVKDSCNSNVKKDEKHSGK